MTREANNSITLFYCYAPEDQELRNELDKQLKPLIRQYRLHVHEKSDISPGIEWERELQAMIDKAHITLLLVSPDFMTSPDIYDRELPRAIERHQAGQTSVIPILLRPVDWQAAPFSHLPVLPQGAKPVTMWPNRDEAFLDVARGIRQIINEVNAKQTGSEPAREPEDPPPSLRESILQILYEKRDSPTFDGEDLAQRIGKRWHEIQSEVADLEEKGYLVTRRSIISTRIFHRPRLTALGVQFVESGVSSSL